MSFINLNNNSNNEKIIFQNKNKKIKDKSYCENYSHNYKKLREYENELNNI
jgi:hypothetical protein